jgi:hypothetical protein
MFGFRGGALVLGREIFFFFFFNRLGCFGSWD